VWRDARSPPRGVRGEGPHLLTRAATFHNDRVRLMVSAGREHPEFTKWHLEAPFREGLLPQTLGLARWISPAAHVPFCPVRSQERHAWAWRGCCSERAIRKGFPLVSRGSLVAGKDNGGIPVRAAAHRPGYRLARKLGKACQDTALLQVQATDRIHDRVGGSMTRPEGKPRGGMRGSAKRHPLASFLVLAYAITWLAWLPDILGYRGYLGLRDKCSR